MGNVSSVSEAIGKVVAIRGRSVRILKHIAEGGYSFVFVVEDVRSGKKMALKRILCVDEESLKLAEYEIRIMETFCKGDLPMVRYYGHTREVVKNNSTQFLILMELCEGGSLIDKLNSESLSFEETLRIFSQICRGVEALHTHSKPIAHRDLKVDNVLFDRRGEVKLCDFGSCTSRAQVYRDAKERAYEEERISKYTTPSYRAPEMVDLGQRLRVDEKVDIWALGCILFLMVYKKHPFAEGSPLQILDAKPKFPKTEGSDKKVLRGIIKKCLRKEYPLSTGAGLTYRSKKRPSASVLLSIVENALDPSVPIVEEKKKKKKKPSKKQSSKKKRSKKKKKEPDSSDESSDALPPVVNADPDTVNSDIFSLLGVDSDTRGTPKKSQERPKASRRKASKTVDPVSASESPSEHGSDVSVEDFEDQFSDFDVEWDEKQATPSAVEETPPVEDLLSILDLSGDSKQESEPKEAHLPENWVLF